jgi:hypothetical protein
MSTCLNIFEPASKKPASKASKRRNLDDLSPVRVLKLEGKI